MKNMFEYECDGIYFRCHEEIDSNRELRVDNEIDFIHANFFSYSESGNYPFDPKRVDITFDPTITKICYRIFGAVKKMYSEGITERYSSLLVARLFEKLAGFWSSLLSKNQDRVGIVFWRKILLIVQEWKKENHDVFIHTGTPYYFLAETYFLVGDFDSGFTYLHNALKIDEQSWQWNYDGHIGAYSLAKLIDDPRTQMNFLTKDIRNELIKYIQKFSDEYSLFTIDELDKKFLKNEDRYHILGYFFTVTFYIIIHNKRNAQLETPENYFSKLRSLDMIFNLCLIIDKILKRRFFESTEEKTIQDGISELCGLNIWVDYNKLLSDWRNQKKYDEANPEKTIPLLLNKKELYGQNHLPKGEYAMMLSHYCRNLGAHTLNEKSIFVEYHDQILNDLMMALFFSIKSIN